LSSVPYRNQLNFTFDGLKQAATSVERLRNFWLRLTAANFSEGATATMVQLALETVQRMKSALEDDLNTAQAQAAIFDMVRKANAAIDNGEIRKDDVAPLLAAMDKFEEIFAVLKDDDVPKMKSILEWAKSAGREQDISNELLEIVQSGALSSEQVNHKVAEMEQARRARNFSKSDAIRAELAAAGIIVENTKDGVRWKRK